MQVAKRELHAVDQPRSDSCEMLDGLFAPPVVPLERDAVSDAGDLDQADTAPATAEEIQECFHAFPPAGDAGKETEDKLEEQAALKGSWLDTPIDLHNDQERCVVDAYGDVESSSAVSPTLVESGDELEHDQVMSVTEDPYSFLPSTMDCSLGEISTLPDEACQSLRVLECFRYLWYEDTSWKRMFTLIGLALGGWLAHNTLRIQFVVFCCFHCDILMYL